MESSASVPVKLSTLTKIAIPWESSVDERLAQNGEPMRYLTVLISFAISAMLVGSALADDFNSGNIDGKVVTQVVSGDIHITGKIDGGARVTLISTSGSITIDGKIDGGSRVTLKAAQDINIAMTGDADSRRIDGSSQVAATAGGKIMLGGKIDGEATVHFKAGSGIDIADKIDNGKSQAFLKTDTGKIQIHNKVDGGATVVYWPSEALDIGTKTDNAKLTAADW
jgi:hypothetical protein